MFVTCPLPKRSSVTRGLAVFGLGVLCALQGVPTLAEEAKGRAWWWDESWWSEGKLEAVQNYPVESRQLSYKHGDIEVPVMVFRPKGKEKFPGVLYVHGRRGLDDLVQAPARRLAARGFVVYAPDLYTGRDIDQFPVAHDYILEDDLNKGLDVMLTLPDIKDKKVCVVGISRGGYYALKLAVTKQRQQRDLACYVAYYPAMQDPNAPEPAQVYQYAPEVDALTIPVLIFVGEKEQYHRKRAAEASVEALKAKGIPVQLVEYPGVGRGFDFRAEDIRVFADDLAAKDAMQRTANFIRRHLTR
jgi:carboxymethylenebutenolidase